VGFFCCYRSFHRPKIKKLIFNSLGSFLGSTPVSQIDYLSGFLDALYFVEKNGAPDPVVTNCLFEDENTTKTLTVLILPARLAVREAKKRGDKNFSVVDVLVVKLKQICPMR
jgi:hypothetical protein